MTQKRLKAPARRAQLLETANDLFSKHGYHGATTAELASAAGVTEPILYRHFDNKLDMYVTLVAETGAEAVENWSKTLDGAKKPAERLSVLLNDNPLIKSRGRNMYRVILQAMTESEKHPEIGKAVRKHLSDMHSLVEREIKGLQTAGTVRKDLKADSLAWNLLQQTTGYAMFAPMRLSGHKTASGDAKTNNMLESLLTGKTKRGR